MGKEGGGRREYYDGVMHRYAFLLVLLSVPPLLMSEIFLAPLQKQKGGLLCRAMLLLLLPLCRSGGKSALALSLLMHLSS